MEWRFFQKEDLYWIQEVSKDFLKESAWGNRVKINKEKVINYFFATMNKPNMFGIVSLKEEKPTGFMIGCLLEFPYSKDKFAKQLELYVVPKERGKMTGIQMMKKFIVWSKMQGAQEVIFDVSTQVGSFDKLAQRLEMKEVGKSYRKIL